MSLLDELKERHGMKNKILGSTGRTGKMINGLEFPRGVKRIALGDRSYKFYPKDEVLKAMRSAKHLKYSGEEYDCEDFSRTALFQVHNPEDFRFPLIAAGEARGYYPGSSEFHSIVVFWTSPRERVYFEPQTGQVADNFLPTEMYI